jgi:hypothetical protein
MKNKLQDLLLAYIRENNPDLLEQLLTDDALQAWVHDKINEVEMVLTQSKPFKAIEAESMEIMTADLRPNRIRYIRDLFEERFPDEYEQLITTGLLTYELVAMVALCQDLFEIYPITEDMEHAELDRQLVIKISEYLLNQYQPV